MHDETEELSLNEEGVFDLTEEKVFARGVDLFGDGDALLGLHRQGASLRGWCRGSDVKPYALHAVIAAGDAIHTHCNCPYSYGGICKHLVALLLAWCHTPEAFAMIPPLDTLLKQYTRAQLVEILTAAVDRDPRLLAALAPDHFQMPRFDEWDDDGYDECYEDDEL